MSCLQILSYLSLTNLFLIHIQAIKDKPSEENDKDKDRDKNSKGKAGGALMTKTEDLFLAHDFDIRIDLDMPVSCKYGVLVSILTGIEKPFFLLLLFYQLTWFFYHAASNPVSVTPKPASSVKDTGPRRSLNLEDYKKKRGLI